MNINLLIVIASVVSLLPIFFIKEYIRTNKYIYIAISLVFYVCLAICYINIFKQKEISSSYTLLQIIQILIIAISGIFVYKETLSIKKIIGIISGIIACYTLI
jgi:multidrug transporter EmrE-like cation transporter